MMGRDHAESSLSIGTLHGLRRRTVSLGMVASMAALWLMPLTTGASPSDTMDDGYAFSTAATGLIETGPNDLEIGSDRERLDEDESEDDPGDGTAGFVVVSEGTVVVEDDELGPVAVLKEGDAYFVASGSSLELRAIEDDATLWRFSLSATGDLPGNSDATIDGDGNASPDAMRQVSIRTGLVPSDVTATLGEDDEQVPFVFAISGDAQFEDGGDIDEGDVEEADSNQVEAADGSTFIGFLAVGPAQTLDGSGSRPEPTATPVVVNGSGDGGDDGSQQPQNTPTTAPEPPTPEPTATETPVPEEIIDTDSDGLSDSEELALGTDPNVMDTDLDGLSDGREVNSHGTNPLSTDTDSDGLTDGREIDFSADPNSPDTDGDGLGDAFEVNSGFSEVTLADTDGDGDDDLAEFSLGTDPRDPACFAGPGSVCQP